MFYDILVSSIESKAEKMVDDKSRLNLFIDTKAPEKVQSAASEKESSTIPSAQGLSYYQQHKEKIKKDAREYYQQHREEKLEYAKKYKHRKRTPEQRRIYYHAHKEEAQKYNLQHREKMIRYLLEYRSQHKEEIKEIRWIYLFQHPERRKIIDANRRVRFRNAGKLTIQTIQEVYDENIIANGGVLKCIYCHRELTHREATLEHKQPISRDGTNNKENLAIACLHCNLTKNDKTEKEFREFIRITNS